MHRHGSAIAAKGRIAIKADGKETVVSVKCQSDIHRLRT